MKKYLNSPLKVAKYKGLNQTFTFTFQNKLMSHAHLANLANQFNTFPSSAFICLGLGCYKTGVGT